MILFVLPFFVFLSLFFHTILLSFVLKQVQVNIPVSAGEDIEDDTIQSIFMLRNPLPDRFSRNLSRSQRRKAKYAGGNAAEGNALQPVPVGQLQAGSIAQCQLNLLLTERPGSGYDGADGMQDILGRQIEPRCYPGAPRGLLAALHHIFAGKP